MDTLYSEVERLSLSWEELDARLAEQVITLEKWEEEKEKLLSAVSYFPPFYLFKICSNVYYRGCASES